MNSPEEMTGSFRRRKLSIRFSDFYLAPNILTISRVLGIPIMIAFLYWNWNFMALGVFLAIGLTDWFDGFIARRYRSESKLGVLLDPLADKLIIISTMIMLMWLGRLDLHFLNWAHSALLSPILVIVTTGREIGITGLRAIASAEGLVLGAERGGKIKTVLQFISISLLILGLPQVIMVGQILLLISVAAALWSGVGYVLKFIKGLPD